MTALALFDFAGQSIRGGEYAGEPVLVGKDVCDALGIAKYRDALAQLDDDERVSIAVDTPGGRQVMTAITEGGIWSLAFIARSAQVKPFRRWVTHEVLPAIRQTGGYRTPALPDITTPAGVLVMAEQFAATARALVASREEVAALEPRAHVADTFLEADGSQSVADTAKELASRAGVDVGARRLFDVLEDLGWIYKERGDGRWHCYQRAVARGLVQAKPQTRVHPDTGERVVAAPQVRVTPKGLERLLVHLQSSRELASVSR